MDAVHGAARALVPRTRSSHDFAAGAFANFGFKSGTRIIELLVSSSIPKFAQSPLQILANFGIGTLAPLLAKRTQPDCRSDFNHVRSVPPVRSATYSFTLMPASAMTLAHLAMSVLMVVPSTAGVLPTVSTPI
jgi:hypothetical protein